MPYEFVESVEFSTNTTLFGFTNIPQDGQHLLVYLSANGPDNDDRIQLRSDGNTSDYDVNILENDGGSGQDRRENSRYVYAAGGYSDTGLSCVKFSIVNYSGTINVSYFVEAGSPKEVSDNRNAFGVVRTESSSDVNSIQFEMLGNPFTKGILSLYKLID